MTQVNKFIKETIFLSEKLNNIGNVTGVILIILYFFINTMNQVYLTDFLEISKANLTVFRTLFYMCLCYKPMMLFLLAGKGISEKIETIKYKRLKKMLVELFDEMIALTFKPKEFIVIPLKFIFITIFFISHEVRSSFFNSKAIEYCFFTWVSIDVLLSLLFAEVKVSFMRSYSPGDGFFCKLDGFFEETLAIIIPTINLINAIKVVHGTNDQTIQWVCFFLKALLLIFTNFVYLRELPFFNKIAELVFGNSLSFYSTFFIIYGACQRDMNMTLKLWCFIAPFQVISYRYFLKRAYCVDYLDKSQKKSLKGLKKILVDGHGYGSIEEKLYDNGVLKNYLVSGKVVNKQYLAIWKKMINLKNRGTMPIIDSYDTETASLNRGPDEYEADHADSKVDEEEVRKVYNEIDNLILNDFIKERNRSVYSHLIKILWMLKNKIVVSEILRSLADMANKSNTVKSRFMYFYAKKQIEKTLKGYYYHKDLYFSDKNELKSKKIIKIEHELQKINDIGVDLSYAFFYKKGVKDMVDHIEKFIKLNKKYVSLLRAQSKSLRELNETCIHLYNLKIKIGFVFDKLHSQTKNVEVLHLTPYFYFLTKCINLHRSASKIFKEYKQRIINKKNLIDEKSMVITDVNLFHQTAMFMVESQKKGFGTILDVYGNTKYLKITPIELKGKHIDCLIVESQRTAHSEACKHFVDHDLSPLMGEMRSSFIKLPEKDYMLKASYIFKIIPYDYSDFKFITAVRYNRIDSRMYIVLDKYNKIDCFSYNMRFLFKNSKNILDSTIPLEDLSPETHRVIEEQIRLEKELMTGAVTGNHLQARMDHSEFAYTQASHEQETAFGGEKTMRNLRNHQKNFNKKNSTFDLDIGNHDQREQMSQITADFFFKNKETGTVEKRKFLVDIYRKAYNLTPYRYFILALTSDDDEKKDWFVKASPKKQRSSEKNISSGNQKTNTGTHQPSTRLGGNNGTAADKSNTQRSVLLEGFENELPIVTDRHNTTNTIKLTNPTNYKFFDKKSSGDQDSSNPKTNTINDYNAQNINNNLMNKMEPILEDKNDVSANDDKSSFDIWDGDKKNRGGNKDDEKNPLNRDKRLIKNGESDELKDENMIDLKINIEEPGEDGNNKKNENESNMSVGYNNENIGELGGYQENRYQYNDSSSFSGYEEDQDEIDNLSDMDLKQRIIEGTGSVFSNANIQTHKKYYAFEDAVKKRAALFETVAIILLYFFSLGATIFFTLYIEVTLKDKNHEFEVGNDMLTAFCEHTFESQMYYSKILTSMAYIDGVYKKDRYKQFDFKPAQLSAYPTVNRTDYSKLSYKLDDIESYQKYQLNKSKEEFLSLMDKIYTFMGEFGAQKSIYFDYNITYYQHEVNGTQVLKKMSIYQGYLLMLTSKSIEMMYIPISEFGQDSLTREILYFFDNSLNGLPMAYEPFNEKLYSNMNGAYEEFMSFVLNCLIIIVALIVVLMFISISFILRIKRMFWDIYQCYTNITEGEYDERFKQLTTMTEMIYKFKMYSYFHDFMGFREDERPTKDAKKKGKKYQGTYYCFRLLFSIGFIALFYLIQMSFSSIMMLIFQDNVSQALWITDKQWKSKILTTNQLIFYNALKQKILFDKETKGFNKSIDAFLPEWNKQIKNSSDTIFQLFEETEGSTYASLEVFLKEAANKSLCSFVDVLKTKKELCDLLDNQISTRGIVQVFFRITQYLEEIFTQVEKGKLDRSSILNDPEYIELEYTFENVYYPSFVFLEHEVHRKFEEFVYIKVNEAVDLIITMMICFIVVSFFFTIFSFDNIIAQIDRVSFSFQLLSINTIIGNIGIKYRFLKVYRLNQKHF